VVDVEDARQEREDGKVDQVAGVDRGGIDPRVIQCLAELAEVLDALRDDPLRQGRQGRQAFSGCRDPPRSSAAWCCRS